MFILDVYCVVQTLCFLTIFVLSIVENGTLKFCLFFLDKFCASALGPCMFTVATSSSWTDFYEFVVLLFVCHDKS
jgi:hypothetical protein